MVCSSGGASGINDLGPASRANEPGSFIQDAVRVVSTSCLPVGSPGHVTCVPETHTLSLSLDLTLSLSLSPSPSCVPSL